METVPCNSCHSTEREQLFIGRDYWFGLEGEFPMVRCLDCGLIYQNPRPTPAEISAYYPSNYTPFLSAIEDETSGLKRLSRRYGLAKQTKLFLLPHPEAKMVDIGCSTGVFLNGMRAKGWDVTGVEPSKQASEYGQTRLGLPIINALLEEADLPAAQFDLITFWNVVEHLHDPRETLVEAARLAKPEGQLMISVPNPDSVEAKLFGEYWAGWDMPRHLYIFRKGLLETFLRETGWEVEKIISRGGRVWLLRLSFRQWVTNRVKTKWLQNLLLKVVNSPVTDLVTLPYFWLVEGLNRGSIMLVFAKRIDEPAVE